MAAQDDVKKKMVQMRQKFFAAGSKGPSPQQQKNGWQGGHMAGGGPKPNRIVGNQQGIGPVRSRAQPAKRVTSTVTANQNRPKWVTHDTNPELSSKQAGIINKELAGGYRDRLNNVMDNSGDLDQTYQQGLNAQALAKTSRVTQTGLEAMRQKGANDRQSNDFANRLVKRGLDREDTALTRTNTIEDRTLGRSWALQDAARQDAMDIYNETGDAEQARAATNSFNPNGAEGPEYDFSPGKDKVIPGKVGTWRNGQIGTRADGTPIFGARNTVTGELDADSKKELERIRLLEEEG